MDDFALQLKTVCLVSILTGVIGAVIPSGRLKKAFNSFCAVVIVFAIMIPLSSLVKSVEKEEPFDFNDAESEIFSQSDTAEKLLYKKVLEKALNDRLSEIGLSATVAVECIKAEGNYEIVSFIVTANIEEEREKVIAYFNECFNGIPVYFKEEQNG